MLISTKAQNFTSGSPTPGRIRLLLKVSHRNVVVLVVVVFCGSGSGKAKTASMTDMLSDLKWDTLETRRKKNRLTLMYKLSHNLVDINTEEHLIPNSELRTRNSHAFKYRMPKVSKDVFKFSFFPRSITEWNSLPADLVNCKSLSDFKLNLGKHVK